MKAAIVLALLLSVPASAQLLSPPFTVDCDAIVPAGDVSTGAPGLWVVGALDVVYIRETPFLRGVVCNGVPGTSLPVVPQDGIVCFCPSKTETTSCHAHADWTEPVTATYCLQSPIEEPTLTEEAPSLTVRRGRIRVR
jgi:hypothetical protein